MYKCCLWRVKQLQRFKLLFSANCTPSTLKKKVSTAEGYYYQKQIQQKATYWNSHLSHVCNLDIDKKPEFVRQTCIVCTIGESCDNPEILRNMFLGGMNIARLNLTLGTYKYHTNVIRLLKEVEKTLPYQSNVAIAVDVTAPTVRTAIFNDDVNNEVELKDGQFVTLTVDNEFMNKSNEKIIWIDNNFFPNVIGVLNIGDRVYIDDGYLSLIVREKLMDNVKCLVEQGGSLGGSKRVQIPRSKLYRFSVMEKYRQNLLFAVENEVDFIFASFVESGKDVQDIKNVLGDVGRNIALISKIETKTSSESFDSILENSDGILISRGDLGLEVPIEKIVTMQKNIVAKCLRARKPVLVATQMLESMRYKPRATRAETSDCANAVLDGVDGIVLGPETARGLYPLESLKTAHDICREAESAIHHQSMINQLKEWTGRNEAPNESVASALAAVEASMNSHASVIIVVTTTGRSARLVASYRPMCPILTVVRRASVARLMHLHRGVHPVFCSEAKLENWSDDTDLRINYAIQYGVKRGFLMAGDRVVIVTGWYAGINSNNTVRTIELPHQFDNSLEIMRAGRNVTVYND